MSAARRGGDVALANIDPKLLTGPVASIDR
jgi:hypothetical protein